EKDAMSPDPEVSTDDSTVVPQNAPKAEWPKKIRTLSAAELDRLTIDSEGRFYWDGNPVAYQPPEPPPHEEGPQTSEPTDLDALALLDRAARELSHQPHSAEPIEPTVVAHPEATHDVSHHDVHGSDSTAVTTTGYAPVVGAPMAPNYEMTYRLPAEK